MKTSGIGGQAVIEGVMMKNRDKYAVAVRTPEGEIEVKTERYKSIEDRIVLFRLPIFRGIASFASSLSLGMKTLMYSADFYDEQEEEEEKSAKVGPTLGDKIEMALIMVLSVIIAVFIFMLIPFLLSELLKDRVHSQVVRAVIEGVLRILLFLGYVLLISQMRDIKRVFMYHGAEHKTINCVEHGYDLTVENVRKQSCSHKRCGTSFLLFVMIVSIIFFIFIYVENIWLRMLYRILLIPVIAGVSYEFIRYAGSHDNFIVRIISFPGLMLQKLTTREPSDDMMEVAIASVEAVFDWKKYQHTLEKELARKKKHLKQHGKRENMSRQERKSYKKQQAEELRLREAEFQKKVANRARNRKEQEESERKMNELMEEVVQIENREKLQASKKEQQVQKVVAPKTSPNSEEEDAILSSLDRFLDDK